MRPFREMWRAIGATGDADAAHDRLVRLYSGPHRAYHNLCHVEACLRDLDKAWSLCADPVAVEAALWFHDAICDPRAKDNEDRSARLALDLLALPPDRAAAVESLILDTKHSEPPKSADGEIIADIDLAIFGAGSDVFDAYCGGIRREYEWVDDATYGARRSAILDGFLSRSPIYRTRFFRGMYEDAARGNLGKALAALAARHEEGRNRA